MSSAKGRGLFKLRIAFGRSLHRCNKKKLALKLEAEILGYQADKNCSKLWNTLCFSVVEITGNKRTLTGVHTHTAFALGYTLNSLVSYFIRDWRWFYFAISLTPIPYFLIHFFVSTRRGVARQKLAGNKFQNDKTILKVGAHSREHVSGDIKPRCWWRNWNLFASIPAFEAKFLPQKFNSFLSSYALRKNTCNSSYIQGWWSRLNWIQLRLLLRSSHFKIILSSFGAAYNFFAAPTPASFGSNLLAPAPGQKIPKKFLKKKCSQLISITISLQTYFRINRISCPSNTDPVNTQRLP